MTAPIGYSGAHRALVRVRGRAKEHKCQCGSRAQDWAFTHTDPGPDVLVSHKGLAYSLDPTRYVPMCKRCHHRYDHPPVTHCPRGHEYTEENTRIGAHGEPNCRTCTRARARISYRLREGGICTVCGEFRNMLRQHCHCPYCGVPQRRDLLSWHVRGVHPEEAS